MYRSLADAVRDAESQGKTLSEVALAAEAADSGRPVDDIRASLRRALAVMRGAVDRGLAGDLRSSSGLVGGDAAKLRTGPAGPLAGTPFRDVLARARPPAIPQPGRRLGAGASPTYGNDGETVSALVEGTPVGWARMLPEGVEPGVCEVTLSVDPAWQRRGIGTRLLAEVARLGVTGRDVTPFLLGWFHEHTGGASLAANVALVLANAVLAAQVATELAARAAK